MPALLPIAKTFAGPILEKVVGGGNGAASDSGGTGSGTPAPVIPPQAAPVDVTGDSGDIFSGSKTFGSVAFNQKIDRTESNTQGAGFKYTTPLLIGAGFLVVGFFMFRGRK